ncbi:MAG: prenyltransferase [Anaerolineae bacterium]|nr:prenyltransferase [Anaerolineae bacterium]
MKDWKQLLGPLRVDFLWMDASCVLLGWGAAAWGNGQINLGLVFLTFLGALAAHVSVNAFNEYFDFASGLDQKAERTPFSGGSGTLQQQPDLARWALGVAMATLALTAAIGLLLVYLQGWELIPIGVLGLFVIVVYTPWITHHPLLALLACGFGFGTLMINGTNFALTGGFTWTAFTASMIEFFQGNALLLLNQFPDVEADRAVGRRNLPIVIGRQKSSYVYALFLLAIYLTAAAGMALGTLPWPALLIFVNLPFAIRAARGAVRNAEDVHKLMPALADNVILNLSTPALTGIGLLLAALFR